MADQTPPDDNAFDNLSRIVASPMPRRKALKLAAGLLGSAALASLWPVRLFGEPAAQKKLEVYDAVLKTLVLDVRMFNACPDQVITLLRERFRVPISLFQQREYPLVNIDVTKGTVQDVLHQLRQQAPEYQVNKIKDRIVVFDDVHLLTTKVSGIDLDGVPKIKAAALYSMYLQQHIKGFEHFGTRFGGLLDSAEFRSPVTLSRNATVIQNLVELLGDAPDAVFTVVPEASGWLVFTTTKIVVQGNELPFQSSRSYAVDLA